MAADDRSLEEILAQKARLARLQDARQRELVRAWVRAWDEINAEMQRTITAMMREATTGVPLLSRARRLRHQREALRIVSDRLERLLVEARVVATADAVRLIQQASSDTRRLLQMQLPLDHPDAARIVLSRADAGQIEQIVRRTTEQITARHVPISHAADVAMRRELARTMAVGDNPRVAARRMLAAVRGEFDGGLTRALVIARTEQISAYRLAAQAEQNANADILKGWQWICTLSQRTCPSCISHHGEMHSLDEPGPEDHHQGRCARMPVTKSWAELGFKGVKEPPPAVRQGDGLRWLESQSEETQRSVLGNRRFEAWRSGEYPPEKWSVKRETPGWRDSWHVGPLGRQRQSSD